MNIDCQIIRDLLPLYNDKTASESTVRLVKEHLEACPECRRYSRTHRIVPLEAELPLLHEDFLALSKRLSRRRRINTAIYVTASAAASAILGLTFYKLLKK